MERPDRVTELLLANNGMVEKNRQLKHMLIKCREQFKFYADEHEKKAINADTVEGTKASLQKAKTNLDLALEIQETLDGYFR